jgi:hypothetical protein
VLFNKSREWLRRENMDMNSEGISAGSTSKINAAMVILGINRQAGSAGPRPIQVRQKPLIDYWIKLKRKEHRGDDCLF